MEKFILITAGFFTCSLITCIYMLIRNMWVYEYRTNLIWSDFDKYEKLPSYNDMVLKYWYKYNFDDFFECEVGNV